MLHPPRVLFALRLARGEPFVRSGAVTAPHDVRRNTARGAPRFPRHRRVIEKRRDIAGLGVAARISAGHAARRRAESDARATASEIFASARAKRGR
jgi:hypothetical protein